MDNNKCEYCDEDSGNCMYWKNPLNGEWYLELETSEWDDWNDGFVVERCYEVKYCTYCGKKLI